MWVLRQIVSMALSPPQERHRVRCVEENFRQLMAVRYNISITIRWVHEFPRDYFDLELLAVSISIHILFRFCPKMVRL